MYPSTWKVLAVTLVSTAALAFAAGWWSRSVLAEKPLEAKAAAPVPEEAPGRAQAKRLRQLESMRWYLADMDQEKRTIDLADAPGPDPFVIDPGWPSERPPIRLRLVGIPVAKDATITVRGKKARFYDLLYHYLVQRMAEGAPVLVRFAKDKPVISRIDAIDHPPVGYLLSAVDARRSTISVVVDGGELKDLPVAKEKAGKLKELKSGMRVPLKLRPEEGRLVVQDFSARK